MSEALREVILPPMRFIEDRGAGYGVRVFRNLDAPPEGPKPGHLDLGWASMVKQVGTTRTGRLEYVIVFYHQGRRRKYTGAEANKILRVVQEHRSDALPV